jgi:hypothetical protein
MEFAIRNIILKAVTDIEEETRGRTVPLSGNEFLEALFAKMFPPVVPQPPPQKLAEPEDAKTVTVARPEETTPKKKPGPKPKLDADGNPIAKKPRAKKAEVPPATPEKSEPVSEAEAPPAPKKPRAKKEKGPVNLEKLTPTQTKQLKKLADEAKVEVDKKAFVAHLNDMTAEAYNATSLDEHMKAFVHSRAGGVAAPAEPEVEEEEAECVEMDFNGITYYVNPDNKKVYVEEGGGHVFKGYVGMAAFAEMTLPADI